MKKDDFLLDSSSEDSSGSVDLVVDKAQEGELQIEQMEENNVYDVDLNTLRDKPWLQPGADITDYFNYGFTEKTWEKYCEMQRSNRAFGEKFSSNNDYSRNNNSNDYSRNNTDRYYHKRQRYNDNNNGNRYNNDNNNGNRYNNDNNNRYDNNNSRYNNDRY